MASMLSELQPYAGLFDIDYLPDGRHGLDAAVLMLKIRLVNA
ncbi:hypothetical protein [Chitinimonas sp. BJB300]|nr:hypothetical protein [Chitinimonas sp. BJB300]